MRMNFWFNTSDRWEIWLESESNFNSSQPFGWALSNRFKRCWFVCYCCFFHLTVSLWLTKNQEHSQIVKIRKKIAPIVKTPETHFCKLFIFFGHKIITNFRFFFSSLHVDFHFHFQRKTKAKQSKANEIILKFYCSTQLKSFRLKTKQRGSERAWNTAQTLGRKMTLAQLLRTMWTKKARFRFTYCDDWKSIAVFFFSSSKMNNNRQNGP